MPENGENNKKSEVALREEAVLKFWREKKIFEKSLAKVAPKGDYVFYDGPVTANSKPVLHTMVPFSFKDAIPRYKTMRGYHVRRKGGWDTHGLPVELQVEKKLGLNSKKAIEEYGIAKFNKECRESVWENVEFWKNFTSRMGYWADQENAYVTYYNDYIESVWHIVKKINDQKLLYKDYKVVPWCSRCGTALSSHELAQGYEDVKDLSVYVKFKIIGFPDAYFLAWTTTPWTLPGNVALAVGKDISYVEIKVAKESSSEILVLAKERLSVITEPYEIIAEHKGGEMAGMKYEPLFPYLENTVSQSEKPKLEKANKVYVADFVNTVDGTGIVHTAVMYGQDDFELGTKVGLPKHHLVNLEGKFLKETGFLEGRFVRETDEKGKPTLAVDIIEDLKKRNLFFKQENYKHSYPHCWRCKTALIYYARDSWYIQMSNPKIKEKLISENKEINWEPEYTRDGRFGDWLKEIKDWAISRERYWGTPLPVWECDSCKKIDVVGSIEDLRKKVKKSGNKYFVMRHGEAIDNAKHIDDPKGDPNNHLTKTGEKEVVISAQKLKRENVDYVFSSPFLRTRETTEIIKRELGLSEKQIIIDDRLHESNEGNHDLVAKRMGEFIYDIETKFTGKNIIIISHGGPLWILQTIATGVPRENFTERHMLKTGEMEELLFVPLPHDEHYELDLHKPYIDEVKLKCGCGGNLVRTKEVMDVWFDSGAMPFAQDHYPFENKKWVEGKGYPADFISEAIDQTRGWFYTLHAVGALMGRGKAFKNVICLGHLLDAKGKKMSKSLGNILDPWTMVDKYGVDALRFWMYSVNQPGESKNFDEKTVSMLSGQVFTLLHNVLAFYELYRDKKIETESRLNSKNILDTWILARLDELIKISTENLDNYKLLEPTRAVRDFIGDLSTWYLRRSRERLKDGDLDAKRTLYFVLKTVAKIIAPLAPFTAEDIWLKLKTEGDKESVHLASWPTVSKTVFDILSRGKKDKKVLENMQTAREVVSTLLKERQQKNIPVRQPLAGATGPSVTTVYSEIIKEEVNIKDYKGTGVFSLDADITPELKEGGNYRELVRAIQDMRKKSGLTPSDVIAISFETNDAGKNLIQKFESDMKKTALVSKIELRSNDGAEIKVDDLVFKVKIEK